MDEQQQPLRIESMSLTNFRGIASIDINFHPQLTLIVGRNGVGKTSVLESLVNMIALVRVMRNPRSSGYTSKKYNHKHGSDELPKCDIKFINNDFVFSAKMHNPTNHFVGNGKPAFLGFVPLMVYYSQNRAELNSRPHLDVNIEYSSMDASAQAAGAFKQWFFDKATDEAFEGQDQGNIDFRDPELEAIRAVVTSIDGIDGITSRAEHGKERDLFFLKHGHRISIDELSSGERVYFILAADLARRLIVAYPDETIETAPGLVLIDEIELHLHPAWQRKIIRQLRETFKNCQFVITTHSPQVVGGVEAECVRLLSADEEGNVSVKTPSASYGRDSNFILEALLDADERVGEVDDLIDAARGAIDRADFAKATTLLDALEATIEGDAPIVNILRARVRRLQGSDERVS